MKSEPKFIDQEHREKAAEDLSESYLVEAAAGTGKTTLLVNRIVNLIKAGEAGLEEIVAITFTEKAAAELKVKLRHELEEKLSSSPSQKEQERLTEAISDLERMQVTTIHSFCAALLRERPVEAGLDPNFEVADNLMASLLQTEVWEEWLEKGMDANDPALRRAALMGITTKQMDSIGKAMLSHRDVLEYLPLQEKMEESVEGFLPRFRESLSALNQLLKYCKDPDEDNAAKKIQELNDRLRKLETLPRGEEREIFVFKEIHIGSTGRLGNKSYWIHQNYLKNVRDQLGSLLVTLNQTKVSISDSILRALGSRLKDYVKAYEEAKRDRNLLDFHDLLIFARNVLKEHPEVRQYFRRHFKFLLVDEFQDTDPLQAEIVFFLSESEKGKAAEWKDVRISPKRLFLVGDPKQSIYRFRRADIEMYEDAKNRMGKERLLSISQNFRCAPSIIEWVNRIFENLIKTPEDGQYQPEYVPIHFGRKKETVPQRHGLVLLYPPTNKNIVMKKMEDCRQYESRCIASFIKQVVAEKEWEIWDDSDQSFRRVMFKDIAVLMRTYTPLDFLEEALRLYEIDYRVVGGKHFYQRQEVEQLLAVLRAVDNPHDKVSLIATLRSPFFGISDEELFLFHANGGNFNYLEGAPGTPLEEPCGLLRDLHEMRNSATIAALLKKLYEATSGLVLFLLKPQGEQRVANLLKMGDVARALSERGVLSFRAFVRWLAERKEEEAEEEEPPTVERGDNFVRLLTIHRAKGLEFPVVILADLAREAGGHEDFIIDRQARSIAIKVGAETNRFWTSNYEELNQWEERRREAEELRLLYVGMTRAREFLALPVYWVKEKKNGEKDVPKKSFLEYLEPHLVTPERASFGKWEKEIFFYDTNALDLLKEEAIALRLNIEVEDKEAIRSMLSRREKWKETMVEIKKRAEAGLPITTATEQVKIREEVERDDEWVISPVTGGEGAIFGKLVHRLFERMNWSQPDLLEDLLQVEGRTLGASGPMIKRAGGMVKEALNSSLLQRVIKSGNYQKEVPFAFKADGTIFEGVMDVVFKEEDGLVVLDFKTDEVERKDLSSRSEHYKPQVKVYSDAIKTILGIPPKEVILFFLHLMETVSVEIH